MADINVNTETDNIVITSDEPSIEGDQINVSILKPKPANAGTAEEESRKRSRDLDLEEGELDEDLPSASKKSKVDEELDELEFELDDIISEEEKYKWEIPKVLRSFFFRYCRKHFTDGEVKEKTKPYPLPDNVKGPHNLDAYMKKLLKGKTENVAVSIDDKLKEIEGHVLEIFGPLGVAWSSVELAKKGMMELDPVVLADQLQTAVILLGRAIQKTVYQRRFQVLTKIGTTANVRTLLHEEEVKQIFEANDSLDLFTKVFDEHLKIENTSGRNVEQALKPASTASTSG